MTKPVLLLLLAASALATDPAAFLRSGKQAARGGEWSKAESHLVRAEDGARLVDDVSLELAARIARVDLRLTAEESDSAATLLPELPSRQIPAADSAAWHLARARVSLAAGDRATAATESAIAVELARRAKESPLVSAAWLVRGRVLLARSDLEGARSAWKKGRSEADDVPALEAAASVLEARIALARGDSRNAAKASQRALVLWRSAQDVGGVLSALPLRAEVDRLAGASASALESWIAAARIAESTRLPRVAVRAQLQAAALDPASAESRRARAREILQAANLPDSSLAPELREQLRR